jgi:hypothetical protein
MVDSIVRNDEVVGSIPTSSTIQSLVDFSRRLRSSKKHAYWTVLDRELDRNSAEPTFANSESCSRAGERSLAHPVLISDE